MDNHPLTSIERGQRGVKIITGCTSGTAVVDKPRTEFLDYPRNQLDEFTLVPLVCYGAAVVGGSNENIIPIIRCYDVAVPFCQVVEKGGRSPVTTTRARCSGVACGRVHLAIDCGFKR